MLPWGGGGGESIQLKAPLAASTSVNLRDPVDMAPLQEGNMLSFMPNDWCCKMA